MSAKVYTKGGDKGMTSLVDGRRVMKSDSRLDAFGTLDELNALVGLARCGLGEKCAPLDPELESVQRHLFVVGSHFACESSEVRGRLARLPESATSFLENRIDAMTLTLPVLKNFILPGGCRTSAYLHMARTVCRRAERTAWELHQSAPVDERHLIYLNRLSDYLFVAARFVNHQNGAAETIWIGEE